MTLRSRACIPPYAARSNDARIRAAMISLRAEVENTCRRQKEQEKAAGIGVETKRSVAVTSLPLLGRNFFQEQLSPQNLRTAVCLFAQKLTTTGGSAQAPLAASF